VSYNGSFPIFDPGGIRTYPLAGRKSKVDLDCLLDCRAVAGEPLRRASAEIEETARRITACAREGKPVIFISGAHPVKNGLAPLIIDLVERGVVSLYASNGAAVIHSLEFALVGSSSEDVAAALPRGEFGMAFETGVYINQLMIEGDACGYGFGEAAGRFVEDAAFRKRVLDAVFAHFPDAGEYIKPYDGLPYAHTNIFGRAFLRGVPAVVPAMMGTDITDQHANFDPRAKGGVCGRDFLVFVEEVCRCTEGGVVVNAGSAVLGPELLLKAVSMAANTGRPPRGIFTADFDMRPFLFPDARNDEGAYGYYFRDQKSVVTRIPESFEGTGRYIQGDHAETLVSLYQYIVRELDGAGMKSAGTPPAASPRP